MQLSELQALTDTFTYKEKVYTVSPFNVADISTLEYEWKKDAIEDGKKRLAEWGEALNAEERARIIESANAERDRRTLDNADTINEVLGSRFGQHWFIYLSVRKKHEEITHEWVDEYITEAAYHETIKLIDAISSPESKDGESPPAQAPESTGGI